MKVGKLLRLLGEEITVGMYIAHAGLGPHLTAKPSITIREAAKMMDDANKSIVVLINDEDQVAGIFTKGDVLKATANFISPGSTPVSKVMTKSEKFIRVEYAASLAEVAKNMIGNKINHALVFSDGVFEGVLSAEEYLFLFV